MKMNKLLKAILIILTICAIGLLITNSAYGWNADLNKYENKPGGRADQTASNIMGAIIHITSVIAAGIAIIMLAVMGVKYVTAGAKAKAEIKKDVTGYVVGAVILFGTSGILRLVQMFIDGNLNNI